MIARHLGEVVLVRGAIPGERVTAWIERAEKRLAYAVTREVLEASPDRRASDVDPLCGGALYSHIAYARQLALKSDVIRDAFARLGRHPLEQPIDVMGSREDGYRMRARLHVHGDRAGFFREGTHQFCDAAPTRQLLPATIETVQRLVSALAREAPGALTDVSVTENIAATERAAHLEIAADARLDAATLERATAESGLRGLSARGTGTGRYLSVGDPSVCDALGDVLQSREIAGDVQRHAEAFFQGNRHLLRALVRSVLDAVPADDDVLDLYAGVGLFSVALAARGHLEVTAVEGDRTSGADLRRNARAFEPKLQVHVGRVEDYLAAHRGRPARTLVVDPPRTGLSRTALATIASHGSPRIVYVSCDPPTLARDARRLLDSGYHLNGIRAFDLFPTTPHVETIAVFQLG
jgi:23S rRNA (uracil1939-C5)-methyltransferase